MPESDEFATLLEDTHPATDERLYVPYSAGWTVHIKQTGGSERCFSQHPGQDFFHLIVNGEIYLESGGERFCLTCAMRRGILSRDRLFWQRTAETPTIEPLDDVSGFSLQDDTE